MEWILACVALGAGFVLGKILKPKKETIGTLWIDMSKPEDPYLYTTLDNSINATKWDTYATFDVKIIK